MNRLIQKILWKLGYTKRQKTYAELIGKTYEG